MGQAEACSTGVIMNDEFCPGRLGRPGPPGAPGAPESIHAPFGVYTHAVSVPAGSELAERERLDPGTAPATA